MPFNKSFIILRNHLLMLGNHFIILRSPLLILINALFVHVGFPIEKPYYKGQWLKFDIM